MNEATTAATEPVQGTEEDHSNVVDATAASPVEQPVETTDAVEDDTVAAVEPEEKKQTGIQRRFQKFNQQLEHAREEVEYWKNQVLSKQPKGAETPTVARPKLEDFNSVEDFVNAREQHLRAELLRELETTAQQKTAQVVAQQSYQARVQAARTELDDWDEVMADAADEPTSPETVTFCMESEVGPRIAYHLAKNPDLHDRLNAMTPMRRIAALGKLEDQLTTPKQQPRQATRAPAKLSEVTGGGAPARLSVDNARSYSEWKRAHEQRQKTAKR